MAREHRANGPLRAISNSTTSPVVGSSPSDNGGVDRDRRARQVVGLTLLRSFEAEPFSNLFANLGSVRQPISRLYSSQGLHPAASAPRYLLPKDLAGAIINLSDQELDRLLAAALAEHKRRGKKLPVSRKTSRKPPRNEIAPPLTTLEEFQSAHAKIFKAMDANKD